MWAEARRCPRTGEPQEEQTIAKAINGGYDLLKPTFAIAATRVSLGRGEASTEKEEKARISVWKKGGREWTASSPPTPHPLQRRAEL